MYTDILKLKSEIIKTGLTQKEIAKILNISITNCNDKINGKKNFTIKELVILKKMLKLTNEEFTEIFFNQIDDETSTKIKIK